MARKRRTLGCLFYVALALLVLVVFLFNRTRVQEVIEKTGFAKLFHRQEAAPVEVVVTPLPGQPEGAADSAPAGPAAEGSVPKPAQQPASGEQQLTVTLPPQQPEKERTADQKPLPKTRQARLFFARVSEGGAIGLRGVIRPVQYVDAPLTATLQALLQGPSQGEISQGLMTLISSDARLLNVYVKNDTAFIDFNEAFRFNPLGKEGSLAQLRQIVYTATEFSNVKRVQLLIEGKTLQYLAPEGVFIGKPLSRESFG
jgi:germination protein M